MKLSLTVLAVLGSMLFFVGSASADGFSEEVKAEFMTGCTTEAPELHCSCVLTKLEAQITEAELIAGTVSNEVIDVAVNECLAEVKFEGEWPAEIKQAFLDGCTSEASEAQCTCVMTKLQAEIPFNDVVTDNIPEEKMNAFVEACR